MHIYKRGQIAARVKLDPAALEAVEAGFAALGRGEVVMPPILSMNIAESNGEVDVKTAHIQGWPRFAVKTPRTRACCGTSRVRFPSRSLIRITHMRRTGSLASGGQQDFACWSLFMRTAAV
jgi:hypothetical protein